MGRVLEKQFKPARQLSAETWSNIKLRFDLVQRLLDKEQILAPHILAIATGKWVSQGRFDQTVGFRYDRVTIVATLGLIVIMNGFAWCCAPPPTSQSPRTPCSSSLVGLDKTVPAKSFS